MRNLSVAALTRKSIVSSIVLAGMTSLALLGRVESVTAKNMTACQVKHSFCSERCIMNSESEGKGNACIQRTCTHQFKACAAQSGESSNPYHDRVGMKPPKGPRPVSDRSPRVPRPSKPSRGGGPTQLTSQSPGSPADQVRVPRGPLGGGILDSLGLGGVRQQGPAAAGSPMAPAAAPSAPPVIIR
jgi:hypothetical protein